MRRFRRLAPVLLIALLLQACGGGSQGNSSSAAPDDPALAQLVAAAKAEGQLTHYSSSNDKYAQAQAKAFYDKYGIKVNIVQLSAAALVQRFSAEQRAGVHSADMLTHTDETLYTQNPSWFEKLSPEAVPYMTQYPDWTKANPNCQVLNENVQGVTYNTDLVPPDKVPHKWTDMLDPFWKGKILLTDPRTTPAYMSWAAIVEQKYGINYLQDLAKQDVKLVDSATPGSQQVASGAYMANFPAHLSNLGDLPKQGAPIAISVMTDAPGGGVECTAIPANAPHPNAAKLFLNWRMTPEGQAAGCAATAIVPPIPDVKGCVQPPAGWKLPTVDFSDPAYQAKLVSALGIH